MPIQECKIAPEEAAMLQLISLVLVIYSYFIVQANISKLPKCIPTHFNAAGVADGWGSPDTLWFLLGAQALTCGIFLLVPYLSQRNPKLVHFGPRKLSDFPPAERQRMSALLNDMTGYLSIVMNVFFVWMLLQIVKAATAPHPRIQPFLPLGLLVGGMAGITSYYFVQFWRVSRSKGNPSNEVRA